MSDEMRFWVVTNGPGFRCKHCGLTHEFWTVDCRPLVFTDPAEWQLHERKIVEDFAGQGVVVLGHQLGRPVEVTAEDAAELGRLMPARRPSPPWDYLGLLGLVP